MLISEMIKINIAFSLPCHRFCSVNVELLKKSSACEDNSSYGN